MKAAITQGAGRPLAVVDFPDPTPAPGELVVHVDSCGICGSDLHLAQHVDLPGIVLGHEFCGTVVAIGADCDPAWREGDRIAGYPLVGCGDCAYCRSGSVSKCASAAQLGLQRPGGFAEYTALAAAGAFRIGDHLDDQLGAMVEPLAVAHHALDRTPRPPEEPVLVIGGGPVGAATALWARHRGARHVVVSDPVAHRRELCEAVGATATIDPSVDDVASAFVALTGHLPGVVVECVGNPGMIQHATDVAAIDGHVTVVGVCMVPDQLAPLGALQKELSTQFVLYYRMADFAATIAALDTGALDPSPMVTGQVGFDALADRFASLSHPTTDCKVLLTP